MVRHNQGKSFFGIVPFPPKTPKTTDRTSVEMFIDNMINSQPNRITMTRSIPYHKHVWMIECIPLARKMEKSKLTTKLYYFHVQKFEYETRYRPNEHGGSLPLAKNRAI